ncbi:MAG TPA: FAD-binding protein [Acidimicrobiales bacterium]|nr:FAD-binding protein [Acidimicrobiales bacterium]
MTGRAVAPDVLDVLVVGSGIAGLSAATALAGRRQVAVVAKEPDGGGSTRLAQGGIAAALAEGDSPAAHAADTLAAAAGLGDPDVAALVTAQAPEAVATLAHLGVHFDRGALAREGGHSCARVTHARGDATGAEISQALLAATRSLRVPILSGVFLVDLLIAPDGAGVAGALIWDPVSRVVRALRATNVVLATGGYGQLWASTTSPRACSGDGLAAALRAGAQLADLEFVQFHPTGIALGHDPRPLATEALRGAGARLRDAEGEYVNGPGGDLAPRDVVSRAMARRMSELGSAHCFLDATSLSYELLHEHFPTFAATCRDAGLDPARDWAPVSPTAHYTMGGVLTDTDGRTNLAGLMVVGEAASSGLHGANRLASNSLLEGAVMGRRAAATILGTRGAVAPRPPVPMTDLLLAGAQGTAGPGGEAPLDRPAMRSAMQALAGVARDADGLQDLASAVAVSPSPDEAAAAGGAGPAAAELANMRLLARAVVALADRRRESRGAHWRTDYPATDPQWRTRQVVQLLPGGDLVVGDLVVASAGGPGAAGGPGTSAAAGRQAVGQAVGQAGGQAMPGAAGGAVVPAAHRGGQAVPAAVGGRGVPAGAR